MKTTKILMCMMAAAMLAGCGSDKPRDEYVAGAAKGRPLDMPPDLVMPKNDGRYAVPSGAVSSATYSEYAKSGALQGQTCGCPTAAEAAAAPAAAPAVAAVPHPALQAKPGGGNSIMLAEPFDRCWLRVSQALDAANITPEDKDRSKGLYYLKGGGQLHVRGSVPGAAPSCEIFIAGGKGPSSDANSKAIDAIYKALGQQ